MKTLSSFLMGIVLILIPSTVFAQSTILVPFVSSSQGAVEIDATDIPHDEDMSLEAAAAKPRLYVRISKLYIDPGDHYYLFVLSDQQRGTGYNGKLDVYARAYSCPSTTQCNGTPSITNGAWGSYEVKNGVTKISLPANMQPSYFEAWYKPRGAGGSWSWSSQIPPVNRWLEIIPLEGVPI